MSSAGKFVLCSEQRTKDTERKPAGMLQTSDIIYGKKRVAECLSLGVDGIGKQISGFDRVYGPCDEMQTYVHSSDKMR
jgi:hypothetical protein